MNESIFRRIAIGGAVLAGSVAIAGLVPSGDGRHKTRGFGGKTCSPRNENARRTL